METGGTLKRRAINSVPVFKTESFVSEPHGVTLQDTPSSTQIHQRYVDEAQQRAVSRDPTFGFYVAEEVSLKQVVPKFKNVDTHLL
jgi:hypothetical protein